MRKQPDFQKLFFDYFGDVPRKVTYNVREDSNRHHDVMFLTSLIHDARFKMDDVVQRGKRLTFNINRDCWELGLKKTSKNSSELYVADARLTISNVLAIKWILTDEVAKDTLRELWIESVWIDRYSFDDLVPTSPLGPGLTLNGDDWQCQLLLAENDIQIRLTDKEIPYLHSERNGNVTNN